LQENVLIVARRDISQVSAGKRKKIRINGHPFTNPKEKKEQ
jgi:hypothetical protein